MNITTRAQGFDMTTAIDQFARNRLRHALDRIDEHVIAIDVFLKDNNGSKGGEDKQSLIHVRLRNKQRVAVDAFDEDMYLAIHNSVKKAKRAVRRHAKRFRYIDQQRARNSVRSHELATLSS